MVFSMANKYSMTIGSAIFFILATVVFALFAYVTIWQIIIALALLAVISFCLFMSIIKIIANKENPKSTNYYLIVGDNPNRGTVISSQRKLNELEFKQMLNKINPIEIKEIERR